MLEPEKYSEPGDFEGPDAAWAEIEACRQRHRDEGHHG